MTEHLTPSACFTLKTNMRHLKTITLQHHNLFADYTRELFKRSKDAASLLVCILKNWKDLDFRFMWSTS